MSTQIIESESNPPVNIDDKICFTIYSALAALERTYRPYLSELGLTYPQYITLCSLWYEDGVTFSQLRRSLRMDINTLSPILQRLEKQELITRECSSNETNGVIVRLTAEGRNIQKSQDDIMNCVEADTDLDLTTLKRLVADISELRDNLDENNISASS